MKHKTGFTTSILHADRSGSIEHGSLHKPLHLSVAYGYRDARELANVFQGKAQGYAYGRQGNPTAAALEEKLAQIVQRLKTLHEENRDLRQQLATRTDEGVRLAEKLAAAKSRIEALLKQIPETES